ncbi:MAG: amidase [Alphaproteobacteria bacterium]|nr:amidase [Alphaproteobacteria bacterium]
MATDILGTSDGIEIAARIRAGDYTAREAAEAAIARAQAVEPRLNAIVTPLFDAARAGADAAAKAPGPLAGAPTFIKDLFDIEGVRTAHGSRAYAGNIAKGTSPHVAAVLRAGLVPLGKSSTPEFGFTATTEPLLGGATRNPWSLEHSSGGSSGGAAALVAAGVVPLAHATDGGGSIRIPAACCGLFGLKPSRFRLIGDRDVDDPVPVSVHGAVARTVRDVAAWLAATERTGADAVLPPMGHVTRPLARPLRIGLVTDSFTSGQPPHPEVRAAVEAAAVLCERLGHAVTPYTPALDGAGFARAFGINWARKAAAVTDQVAAERPGEKLEDLLEPLTLFYAERFKAAPASAYPDAVAGLKKVEADYARLFDDIDVLLTPVLGLPPVKLGEIGPLRPLQETGEVIARYVGYTALMNAAGAPGMSVPLGMSSGGLPIGVHFAAAKGQDALLLELAYQLEEAAPWRARTPPVWAG